MADRDILFTIRVRNEAAKAFRKFTTDIRGTARASKAAARAHKDNAGAATRLSRALKGTASRLKQIASARIGRTLTTGLRGAAGAAFDLKDALRGVLALAGSLGVAFGFAALFSRLKEATLDFQVALSRMVGLVGLSREAVAGFREEILKLAPAVAKSPAELADAMFFITSASLRGEAAMEALTASARAAAGGLGEVKAVARTVVAAVNAYEAAGLTAATATDILTTTVKEGILEASELGSALSRVLSIAEAAGVRFDELGATVAALSLTGQSASQAVTGLRGILVALTRESGEGVKALNKLQKGLTFADIRKNIREKGLLRALQELRALVGDNETAFTDIFGEIEAVNAVLALTGSQVEKVKNIFKSLEDTTGATGIAMGAFAETDAFKLRQAMVELDIVLTRVGSVVMPAVAGAVRFLADNMVILGNVALVVAAKFAGPVILSMSAAALKFGAVAVRAGLAKTAIVLLGRVLTFLGGPIGLAIGAVGLLVTAFLGMRDSADEVSDALDRQVRQIKLQAEALDISKIKTEEQARASLMEAFARRQNIRSLIDEQRVLLEGIAVRRQELRSRMEGGFASFSEEAKEAASAALAVSLGLEDIQARRDELGKQALEELRIAKEIQELLARGFAPPPTTGGGIAGLDDKEVKKFQAAIDQLARSVSPALARVRTLAGAEKVLANASKLTAAQLREVGLTTRGLEGIRAKFLEQQRRAVEFVEKDISKNRELASVARLSTQQKEVEIAVIKARTRAKELELDLDEKTLSALRESILLRQQATFAGAFDRRVAQIRLETSLVGKTAEARERALALFELERDLLNRGFPVEKIEEFKTRYVQAVNDMHAATARLNADSVAGVRSALREYVRSAENNFENFREVATNALTSVEDAFVKFAETGKLSFKGLVNSIFSDLARLSARQVTASLFGTLGGFGDFGFSGAGGLASSAVGGIGARHGGVVGAAGSMPLGAHLPVRRYPHGGVADSLQVAVFGEGSVPEAFVPVPSGRIPVELRGGRTTVQNVTLNNYIQTPDADSFHMTDSQRQGQAAAALGVAARKLI